MRLRRLCVAAALIVALPALSFAETFTGLTLGPAVKGSASYPASWDTAFTCDGTDIVARHIAITSDFRLFDEDFSDNEAYGLNINSSSLVNIMSPFFLDPSGSAFEMDVDRGDAEWTLSYYESRGPLEADYGNPSRNCRPVASYAWGAVGTISQEGSIFTFELLLDPGLISGDAHFGLPFGGLGWLVTFDSSTLTGTAVPLAGGVVPEPISLVFFGTGMVAVAGFAGRRCTRKSG